MTINASDLAVAFSTYKDWVNIKTIRDSLVIEVVGDVSLVFHDKTPEKKVLYSATLTENDLNEVAKVVRRQLLVDLNNLEIQLDALGVIRN